MNHFKHSQVSGPLISVVAVLLLSMTGNRAPSPKQTGRSPNISEPVDVGMVTLIAAPENYEGKFVRTHGFLCIEFEGDAVYLHEEDYRYGLTKNSFALRLTKPQRQQFKSLSLKYILIEGTVYAKGPEQTDRWGGAIGTITRLEAWAIDRGAVSHH